MSNLKKTLPLAHRLLRSPLRELSIALVGDAQMSELHDRFMKDRSATDVLTFPLEENSRGRVGFRCERFLGPGLQRFGESAVDEYTEQHEQQREQAQVQNRQP